MKQSLMKFPNGLRVVLSSRQSNVVTISLSLLFGAEQERKEVSGITHVIERLLRNAINSKIGELGGLVESKTDYEHLEISISTVRENLEHAIKALSNTIFEFRPTYENFKTEQARILQEIENRKASPLMILSDLTQKNRYKTTSLATELIGTTKTMTEMELEDVKNYYSSILTPEQLMLSIVGNISDELAGEVGDDDEDQVNYFDEGEPKESNIKNISVSTTMGPGIKVDSNSFDK